MGSRIMTVIVLSGSWLVSRVNRVGWDGQALQLRPLEDETNFEFRALQTRMEFDGSDLIVEATTATIKLECEPTTIAIHPTEWDISDKPCARPGSSFWLEHEGGQLVLHVKIGGLCYRERRKERASLTA